MENNKKENGLVKKFLKGGAIVSTLGLVSLPLAGAYLGFRKKGKTGMFIGFAAGLFSTFCINTTIEQYQKVLINRYDTGKIIIEHKSNLNLPNF